MAAPELWTKIPQDTARRSSMAKHRHVGRCWTLAGLESRRREKDSDSGYSWNMKTTIDIPDNELEDAIKFMKAKTKREAVVGAIKDFNRRMRMAELTRYAGTCANLISPQELQALRRKG